MEQSLGAGQFSIGVWAVLGKTSSKGVLGFLGHRIHPFNSKGLIISDKDSPEFYSKIVGALAPKGIQCCVLWFDQKDLASITSTYVLMNIGRFL